eukprot:5747159-Alexandrium_andersonii.AAC.1
MYIWPASGAGLQLSCGRAGPLQHACASLCKARGSTVAALSPLITDRANLLLEADYRCAFAHPLQPTGG